MEKDIREIMANISFMRQIIRAIDDGGSLDVYKVEIADIIQEHMDILLNTKVKI